MIKAQVIIALCQWCQCVLNNGKQIPHRIILFYFIKFNVDSSQK